MARNTSHAVEYSAKWLDIIKQPAFPDDETAKSELGTKFAPSRHQVEILHKCLVESTLLELMSIADRTDRTKFRHQVLNPLADVGLIEMTVPDKPQSSKQKYRLTEEGAAYLRKLKR